MRVKDITRFSFHSLASFRLRTFLMLLAMAIGVASVVVLTSLGNGARKYVTGQFASLGTNLLIVLPGRTETTGSAPPLLGETPRDLTLEDSQALLKSHLIKDIAPIVVGSVPVSWRRRDRESSVLGTTASFLAIRHLQIRRGKFLPPGDFTQATPVTVLGKTLARELFINNDPIGNFIRIGGSRFRVIGILSSEGVSLGVDMDDLAIIPVASAQALFNTQSVFRIMIEGRSRDNLEAARDAVKNIIKTRHEGEDDITVITQDAVLATFDKIFTALTLAVGGIAAISLLVAGILIMNVMLVAVSQRTTEIGLLKALGAPRRQIIILFLTEAAFLSIIGSGLGVAVSHLANFILQQAFPDFPVQIPLWSLGAALAVAFATGLIFGILPARRAAGLDPVTALSRR